MRFGLKRQGLTDLAPLNHYPIARYECQIDHRIIHVHQLLVAVVTLGMFLDTVDIPLARPKGCTAGLEPVFVLF